MIVIKNFAEDYVDTLTASLGWSLILSRNQTAGTYFATAAKQSRGDIITFLDDDDEYERNRLETIFNVFELDRTIGYYHNDKTVIDSGGTEIRSVYWREQTRYIQRTGPFRISKPISRYDANRLFRAGADLNMSSIAIRKSVLLPYLDSLRSIEVSQDTFMFYCGLFSPMQMAMDSKKLTKYRLHSENQSTFGYHSGINLEMIFQKRVLKQWKSIETISKMRTEMNPEVGKFFLHDSWVRRVNRDMVNPKTTRFRLVMDSLSYLNYSYEATLAEKIWVLRNCFFSIVFRNPRRGYFRR